jgi:hypothetical protein
VPLLIGRDYFGGKNIKEQTIERAEYKKFQELTFFI